jgi:hypothetical protein
MRRLGPTKTKFVKDVWLILPFLNPNLSDSAVEQSFRIENPEVKAIAAWTKQLPLQRLTQKSVFMGLSTK